MDKEITFDHLAVMLCECNATLHVRRHKGTFTNNRFFEAIISFEGDRKRDGWFSSNKRIIGYGTTASLAVIYAFKQLDKTILESVG